MTAAEQLLGWLDDPARGRGVRCVDRDGRATFHDYAGLAGRARRIAAGLVAAGVPRRGRVAVVPGDRAEFVATFFGVLRAGATVAVLPPPVALAGTAYAEHLRTVLAAVEPSLLVADPEARPETVVRTVSSAELAESPDGAARDPAETALLQFSSGTSGRARGVRIPASALAANAAAIRRWLGAGADDAWASWLPLHHDMGLVGCMVSPVVGGSTATFCRPEDFVRDPRPWLRCFAPGGATITATPAFGLDRVLRAAARPNALDGVDLGGLRCAVVGAERIPPGLLDRFALRLRPHGLRAGALLPAYGLAESTLAVTGTPPGRRYSTARPDGAHRDGPAEHDGRAAVGCGVPLDGMSVRVVDDAGDAVSDGVVGEIEVRGSSLATGYIGDDRGGGFGPDGSLRTGDGGFLRGGELFVLGRFGDSVKVAGSTLFAEDVEAALVAAGLPAGRLAVLLGSRAAADGSGSPGGLRTCAVAVLEDPGPDGIDRAAQVLRRTCRGADPTVVALRRGDIPRTSSGKHRRRALWHAYAAGLLDDHPQPEKEGLARHG